MTRMRPSPIPRVFELDVPVLGICYGLQYMVYNLGGKVRPADKREYGHADVDIKRQLRAVSRPAQKTFRLDVARR